MNALLDYGSSSSSNSDGDSSDDEKAKTEEQKDEDKPKLPKPALGENSLHTSVFSNPFVQAELAKAAILEKHVKMVPGIDNTQVINGKKICWNYRKGKCRFGHNCKYAHDSDIQKTAEELEAEKNFQCVKSVVCEGSNTVTSATPPQLVDQSPTDDDTWGEAKVNKKRRPGLSKSLIPNKKVLKMYKQQKLKDIHNKKV